MGGRHLQKKSGSKLLEDFFNKQTVTNKLTVPKHILHQNRIIDEALYDTTNTNNF